MAGRNRAEVDLETFCRNGRGTRSFLNKPRYRFVEKGRRKDENVYAAFGQTNAGRYLACFFVYKKDNRALILSARNMTDTERKRYGRK